MMPWMVSTWPHCSAKMHKISLFIYAILYQSLWNIVQCCSANCTTTLSFGRRTCRCIFDMKHGFTMLCVHGREWCSGVCQHGHVAPQKCMGHYAFCVQYSTNLCETLYNIVVKIVLQRCPYAGTHVVAYGRE